MKFMVTWSTNPAHQKEATAQFLETGGGPPEGVKMLGRWHGSGMGYVLAETSDVKAIYEWTGRWQNLLQFVVTPVMEDAEAAEVMKKITA
ncbi:MAG TPA: DUF3303 family protein [Terriglobia bacterium]|nr:DUF3303 family protein [Terriglobia bacterium]